MRHKEKSAAHWYLPAVLYGIAWMTAAALLGAAAIWKIGLSGRMLQIVSTVIWCVGAYAAGETAGRRIRRHGIRTGLVCGGLLCLLLLVVCLFWKQMLTPAVLRRFLWILAASAIGGVRGVNTKVHGSPR